MAAFSKHSAGLSFQCAIALTPLADTLAIVGNFLSWSVAAGFVLALPLHHRDLELDSVGVAILVAWPWLGGAYFRDQNTDRIVCIQLTNAFVKCTPHHIQSQRVNSSVQLAIATHKIDFIVDIGSPHLFSYDTTRKVKL